MLTQSGSNDYTHIDSKETHTTIEKGSKNKRQMAMNSFELRGSKKQMRYADEATVLQF